MNKMTPWTITPLRDFSGVSCTSAANSDVLANHCVLATVYSPTEGISWVGCAIWGEAPESSADIVAPLLGSIYEPGWPCLEPPPPIPVKASEYALISGLPPEWLYYVYLLVGVRAYGSLRETLLIDGWLGCLDYD